MIGYLTQDHGLIRAFAQQLHTFPSFERKRRSRTSSHPLFKMAFQLSDLFPEGEILAVRGELSRPISGISMDSRRVVPGHVFFALPGLRTQGASYIDEAINRGAVAVVVSDIPRHTPAKVTFVQVSDPRSALAKAARRYFKYPDRELEVIGVTGTNGKTTVSHLTKLFLETGERVGLLGTVSYDLGGRTVPSFKTTPEAPDTYGMLAQMRDAGCHRAVMEVSSHGIDQRRILDLEFQVAVFTNLTRDHLDYHHDMETYFGVKSRFFTGALGHAPRLAVINLDDPYGRRLKTVLPDGVRALTYGESAEADIRAENIELEFKHTVFTLVWPDGRVKVRSPLVGRYNVSNILAAAAVAIGLGRSPHRFLAKLADFHGVPGRMERIEQGQPFNVLVDYAHTDDALDHAAGMLRAITPGRLFVVFGCGGNRDRTKRPLMVAAAQRHADFTFATADNPRNESLAQIFEDMKAGVTQADKITWIEDRRRAISLALDMCKPGDSLLVAGKGHETYQEFADTVTPFDDRQTVRELIEIKQLRNG